jgi:hypothetical protein
VIVLLNVKLSMHEGSLYIKLPGTKGLILAPMYNVFQLYAFCIFPMHAMFHNYNNILHITTTMMLAEKNVLTGIFSILLIIFEICIFHFCYFMPNTFMFVLPFERSLSSNFCFFKICWKSLLTIIRDKQKIYVKKIEIYEDVCYSIHWCLNKRAIKFYLTVFTNLFFIRGVTERKLTTWIRELSGSVVNTSSYCSLCRMASLSSLTQIFS